MDPIVLRHPGEAMLAPASAYHLPQATLKDTQTLGLLHSQAASRHQPS